MGSPSESIPPNGINVNYQGPRLSKFLAETLSYILLLRKVIPAAFQAHVILSHHHPSRLAVLCAAIASTVSRTPLIVRADDILAGTPTSTKERIITRLFRICFQWSFKRARRILINGEELREPVRQMYRLKADVMGVSPNGVDTERFSPNRRSELIRRGLESRHIVVFSGAIYKWRGLGVLLEAAPYVKKVLPDVKFLILGDGPDLTSLAQMANSSGLATSVQFLGTVSPDVIPDYLASSDVGIGNLRATPVTFGTYPIKILEYMASGCVALTVKGGVSRRLIVHKQTGLVIDSSDPMELASMLVTALSNREVSEKIAQKARNLVERAYSWERVVEHLDAVIRSELRN